MRSEEEIMLKRRTIEARVAAALRKWLRAQQ
jgi:hypothetical protein